MLIVNVNGQAVFARFVETILNEIKKKNTTKKKKKKERKQPILLFHYKIIKFLSLPTDPTYSVLI